MRHLYLVESEETDSGTRLHIFSRNNGEKKIEIIVDGNKVICKGQKSQGWVEIEEKLEGENEAVSFFINPIFLKQILQKTNSVIIGEGRALFKSDKFEHVMLLSVGNE